MLTFKLITFDGEAHLVHDVFTLTRVGTHTYEFILAGAQKVRYTSIMIVQCDYRCLCHGIVS